MGWSLYIGEAVASIDLEERYARVVVEEIDGKEMGAPFNSTENHCNYCWPSYVAWHDFCLEAGLFQVFYAPRCEVCTSKTPAQRRFCDACGGCGRGGYWSPSGGDPKVDGIDGLLSNDGSAKPLTEQHYAAFKAALDRYMGRPEEERDIWVQRRLDWLVWWTRWAIDNCEHPTFFGS